MRQLHSCRHCGFGYKGRGIYADHGLGQYNLEQHEGVCLKKQAARVEQAARARARASRAYRRRIEKTGGVAPAVGQFGFPFDGVPEEVIG